MLIAEFTIDHPLFGEALHRIPDIRIEWEETYSRENGLTQTIAWITSDDFDCVDAAIGDDPYLENPIVLVDLGERRLYRVDYTPDGAEQSLVREYVRVGAVLQESVGTNDGWFAQVLFPDREAYEHIYQFCRDREIDFRFERLYEHATERRTGRSTLTDAQRETLLEAVECGYLEIPRESTLAELAGRLGISEGAASERFRRGVKNLVEHNVE